MSYVPFRALSFGALSLNQDPVSYSKSRVAGSALINYSLSSKAGCMPGQPEIFISNSRSIPELSTPIQKNQFTQAFQRESCASSKIPIGPRDFMTCPYGFTFDKFPPNDDETFKVALSAAYRQIFGNFNLMESERPIDSERRLRNGDINIREFIRQLSRSEFYRAHFYEVVNQQRSIELNFKHFLGRPPISQSELLLHIQLMHEEGLYSHIDCLIDSAEYQEVFGEDVIPYIRCWDSPCGMTASSFNNIAELTRSFATSDNAIHKRKTTADAPSGKSQLLNGLYGQIDRIKIPFQAQFKQNAHKQQL